MNPKDVAKAAKKTFGWSGRQPKREETGWLCPRCGKSNSPKVLACECSPHPQKWLIHNYGLNGVKYDDPAPPPWEPKITCGGK